MYRIFGKKSLNRIIDDLPAQVKCKYLNLVKDLEATGATQFKKQNYSKLGDSRYHCHLGYRYVACWTLNKKDKTIEVCYVGSREGAPY